MNKENQKVISLKESILKEFDEKFGSDLDYIYSIKEVKQFITSALERKHKADMEEVEKWVVENHEHHEWCEAEDRPHGVQGCGDNDQPYVNSLKLVEFLNTLKGKV